MADPRADFNPALLPDGRILAAGGSTNLSERVEIYDPSIGVWKATSSMNYGRQLHTVDLLPNGKVLVAGGDAAGTLGAMTTAELFDPATGEWSSTGDMSTARFAHKATLLTNGKLLVAGGYAGGWAYLSSAEIYDPAAGIWTNTNSMNEARLGHTATLLADGRVLVVGGFNGPAGRLNSAELFDPASGTWSMTGPMGAFRIAHSATLLSNGKVLVTGGEGSGARLSSAEIYDPATGGWSQTDSMSRPRIGHASTLLPNGEVLVTGGFSTGDRPIDSDYPLSSAEIYDPATGHWHMTSSMTTARSSHAAILLSGRRVLVVGGGVSSAEVYGPSVSTMSNHPDGCASGFAVKKDGSGDYTSIQAAINALPRSLSADTCVVILDTSTYAEQVTVRGFTNNGHRIRIMSDPSLANSPPVVSPPATPGGAFVVQNASVSILGINIIAVNGIGYGINASSDSVAISSVNILDPWGRIGTGISLANQSSVSYSSITAKKGSGIIIAGSGNEVSYSTAVTAHLNYRPLHIYGGPSNRITHCTFLNTVGTAVQIVGNGNSITQSVIRGMQFGLLFLENVISSSNSVTQSHISASWGRGVYLGSADYTTISRSTLSFIDIRGSFNNITDSFVQPDAQSNYLNGIYLGGTHNLIVHSTVTAITDGINFGGASNTITESYMQGTNAVTVAGNKHRIESSLLVGSLSSSNGLLVTSVDGFSMNSNVVIAGSQGAGIALYPGNRGRISFASNTFTGGSRGFQIDSQAPGASLMMSSITFGGLSPGATAIKFLSGTVVSDFADVAFADPDIAINVDASALSGDSCINMLAPSGARSGPGFENDPSGFVNWAPSICTIIPQGFTNVSTTGLTINWSSTFGSTKTFYSAISTGALPNMFAGNLSSATANTFTSFSGLIPNTLYHGAASTTPAGPYTQFGSTATLAAAPGQSALIAVTSRTVSLDWSPNGNPEPGTVYELWRDVSNAFPAPVVTVVSTSAAELSGLLPSTTYYLKVRAVNLGGTPSGFDQTLAARTFPPQPGVSSPPSGAALGVSSVAWTWEAAADARSYRLVRSSDGFVLASLAGLSYAQTGLSPNAAYGGALQVVNESGDGPLSPSTTVWTLARPPTGTAAAGVHITSAAVSWNLNGNPAATAAEIQRSSDGVIFASVFNGAATSAIVDSLMSCTTYYFRVRNENAAHVPTDFDSTLTLRTTAPPPAAPNSLTAAPVSDNRIAFAWLPSVSESVVQYRLYSDGGSGSVDYASPFAVFAASETSWTSGPLVSSGSYRFALRARNGCGVEELGGVFAIAGSTASLVGVRAVIKTPDSGKRVAGDSLTIMASLVSGTPDRVREIRFQYRLSGTQAWNDVPARNANHPNPDPDSPYFVQTDVDAWGAGSYDLRAVAVDLSGRADGAPAAVTVVVGHADPDIEEREIGGKVTKQQTVNDAITNTIVAAGASAGDPAISVRVPAGALGGSTVAVTVVSNPFISTGPPAGGSFAGSAVKIDLSNGGHYFSGGLTAIVTLSYPRTVADARRLRIESLDEATGRWSPLTALSIDTENRTITAATPHFSIFAVIMTGAAAASDLGGVRVYPVPYKPNGGDPDEGRPYSAGDANSGIIFDNLPASANIKIYTLSGRLVAQSDASAGGRIQWDARNSDGRAVASGGYFAVVSAPGQKSVVKKLAIIR